MAGLPTHYGILGQAGGVTTVEPAPNKRGKVTLVPWSPGTVGGGVLRVTTLREGSPPPPAIMLLGMRIVTMG